MVFLKVTWLIDYIHSVELFNDIYNTYRRDRDCLRTGKRHGGECLIAIKEHLHALEKANRRKTSEDLLVDYENWCLKNLPVLFIYFAKYRSQ